MVPPATATSAPVSPPVCANTAIITVSPAPLTPSDASRAVVRLPAPSSRTSSKTCPCHARTAASVRALSSLEAASMRAAPSSSSRPAGWARQLPAARSAARSAAAATTASTPVPTAAFSSASPVGLPVTSERSRSRSRPTPRSSARMKSPVPTTSCQRASTSPRSSEPLRTVSSTSSSALAYARSASSRSVSAAATCSSSAACDHADARGDRVERALERAPHELAAGLRVGRERVEPAAHRRERRRRQQAVARHGLLDHEQLRLAQAALGEHRPQVRGDLVHRVGRHAVEDERDGRAAVARRVQEVPRHGVGVARGGGHEQPRVGGGEQLPGERAVGLDDRVDVGRVEQRQPRRQRVGRDELEPARVRRARPSCAGARGARGRPRTSARRRGGRRAPARGWSAAARRRR